MTDEDLKAIISMYQQKAFELFNSNIVLETQVNTLKKRVQDLSVENEKLKQAKNRKTKSETETDFQ
jgi:predicted nuclease with TOPRIM domain